MGNSFLEIRRIREIFILGLLLLGGRVLVAQSISGYINDKEDNSVLPFVSVIVKGTTRGTISDIDGFFTLKPEKFPVTLVFHTLGYSDTVITFHQPKNANIRLSENALQLKDAVIEVNENPAIRIIKKAIANRDLNNPEKNTAFTYKTYSKMVFGPDVSQFNDELILTDSSSKADSGVFEFRAAMQEYYLFITETVSERKFSPPGNSYEKIVANRFSGLNNPTFSMIATEFQPFSYYSDYVDVIGFKYLSPLARKSFKDYVFELKETFVENQDSIFIIYFQPRKGSTFYGLKGTMAISSNQYAIKNIRVEQANPNSSMQIEIEQMSAFIDGKQWFPVQFNTHLKMVLEDSETQDLGISFLNARGKTYMKNIRLTDEIEKKEFPNVRLELEESANSQTDEYWLAERKEKLNTKEERTYVKIDSIGEAEKLDKKLKLMEDLFSGMVPIGPVSIELNKVIDYNEWEGTRLGVGIRTNEKVSKYFSIGAYGAYGFNDKVAKYGGDLKFNIYPKNDVVAGVKYANDVTPTGIVDFHKKETFNLRSYSDLFISKMDNVEGLEAYVNFRSFRDFQNQIFFNQYSQSFDYDYAFTPQGDTILNTENAFTRSEIGWSFRFGYKEKYIRNFNKNISMGTKFPYVWVRLAASDALLGSRFTYQKIDIKVSKNYLVKGFGKVGFQITGGTTTGEVPLSFLHYPAGMRVNGFNLYIENGFNTMAPNEFVSQTYASVFLHYNIGTIYKTSFSAPEISLVSAAGWGELDNPEYHQGTNFKTMEKGFFESGLLLDNIFVMNTSGFGMGVFYRYGPYALPEIKDNFGFSFTVMYVFQ